MGTRLDIALQKFPEHEAGIRTIAARDPSGNLKYIDWSAKVLASGQALAPEIADVVDLFHQFAGQHIPEPRRRRGRRGTVNLSALKRIHPDIHAYRPQDLATMRDALVKLKRARDSRQKKRERLYRIDGSVEAEVVHDSSDLLVRHIKNKQASVHYGLGTKWCIAMLREGYFEDYESQNATFFFFERKVRTGDEFDKVALMVARGRGRHGGVAEAFTAIDRRVDMFELARAYGPPVFDVFRSIHERSEQYPGSALFHVCTGSATQAQVEAVFASVNQGLDPYDAGSVLEAICCNDAAPWSVLDAIGHNAVSIWTAARKHAKRSGRRLRVQRGYLRELERRVEAAIVIHPNAPTDVRTAFTKRLRRRRINVDTIRRATDGDRISIAYGPVERGIRGRLRHRRLRRWPNTAKALRKRAEVLDRSAARLRKRAKKLQVAETKKKKKAAATRSKKKR